MATDPEILRVNVSEKVGTSDAVGGPPPEAQPGLVERLVPPHQKVAREVVDSDLPRVLEDASVLYQLCYLPVGPYHSAHAMAHSQIDATDPLRYFVTKNGEIIINPRVVNHTKTTVDSEEGCMTFPEQPMKNLQRYNVVDLEFQTLDAEKKLTPKVTKTLQGRAARVSQHEIAHLFGHYIYDAKADPGDCLDNVLPIT